ncbi:MAG: Cell surface glycan-binding lipoprotein, utilization system for glycans and polysaccharides (PUL), SusD family [uncultured Cytophagales bacterium]|uniref:Cell surface glycan-binding lipoprotein, utilization system for glycans and polysaccharides (PUL), SusD family n=1 Tax=uncultured Cytophagales bacterium TaxID=158755 RepID=A0A6J4HP52_9SPHI|nr:MAG: Cell surface glycan-binding lipoprotein, utilization system for glycans and polysaccharides (PUL), SusD family [uncultured Cytophagales bacterium]
MKKPVLYTCLAGLLTLANACALEETPYSSIYTNQFFKTAQDAESALLAVYGSVGDLYAGPAPLMVSDFSADQVYPRPVVGRDTYTLFSYDPNYTAAKSFGRVNESPQHIWSTCYAGIEKANWVIARVPDVGMDAARRDQVVAEAQFLRAFFYWMVAKNFGDAVLKTTPSISEAEAIVAKATRAELYGQIYSDLEGAAGLPSYSATVEKGRPAKEVALALHAKAALYNEDWATALAKAQAVIGSGKYALLDDVRDVYIAAREDVARQENLWAFESESTNPGRTSQIMGLYGPRNSDSPAYGKETYGSIFMYPSFYDSFDPADKRLLLLDTSYVNARGQVIRQKDITPITPRGILVKKFQDPNSVGAAHASNIPILRLADVYLVAAEAEARLNGPSALAYGYVNSVRRRAGLPDLAAGLGPGAFVEAVLRERAWELFAEGDRWYDLTRTNKFLSVVPAAVNDVFKARSPQARHRYFPIPQDEINANQKIEQNPEWQ